eukprot:scaffold24564_cov30-Tisochrysis_lutea.AAC.9
MGQPNSSRSRSGCLCFMRSINGAHRCMFDACSRKQRIGKGNRRGEGERKERGIAKAMCYVVL